MWCNHNCYVIIAVKMIEPELHVFTGINLYSIISKGKVQYDIYSVTSLIGICKTIPVIPVTFLVI